MDFSNTSGIKSPFSPRIKQSLAGRRSVGNVSAKKNMNKLEAGEEVRGEVIYKSPQITLETYGPPLPVMVTEALAFANSEVTIKISQCGWCWLVVGRRILVWPLDASAGATANTAARELILPQTDLAHKSDLVDVFYEDDDEQSPSCIGVSPEGVIRYWPSVRHSGVYSEVSAELAGQECGVLQASAPLHLLATTTCTLGAVHHSRAEGRSSVWYSGLRAGGGWLGSLGRRVSLLFFGAVPQQPDIKLCGLAVVRPGGVLTEDSTGLAALVTGGASASLQLFTQHPVASLHLPQLLQRHTQGMGSELGPRELSVLDMKVTDAGELLLLVAFTNRELRYLIAAINVDEPESPRLTWVSHVTGVRIDSRPSLLTSGQTVVIYTASVIAMAMLRSEGWGVVEWGGPAGGLAGGGVVRARIVLCDKRHEPIALTHTRSVIDTPLQSPSSVTDVYTGNLSLLEIDPNEIRKVATDACGILKTALLFHLRKDEKSRDELLRELCPTIARPASPTHGNWQGSPKAATRPQHKAEENREVDAMLDRTAYKVALELLDDIPTGDPRWQTSRSLVHVQGVGEDTADSCRVPLGASCALGAAAQIRDKQLALSLLAHLLHYTHHYNITTDDGTVMSTMSALGALAERLAAALHLHDQQHPALDKALLQVVNNNLLEEDPLVVEAYRTGVLSARDLCFRRGSLATRLLVALTADWRALPLIASTLREMQTCRARWTHPPPPAHNILRPIVDMLPNCVNEVKNDAMAASTRGQMLTALCTLADLLLADTATLQDNPYADRIFNALVEAGEKERALLLAEKYKHFDALIDMCVNHYGLERLYAYIDKYIDEGVPERAFGHVRRVGGKLWSQLLQHAAGNTRLQQKLQPWTTEHDDADILLLLSSGQYLEASESLLERAASELNSNDTVMLCASLSKLCALMSDVSAGTARREHVLRCTCRVLCLCEHVRDLPPVLAQDVKGHARPEDLLQLYIDCEGGLTESDYKQALDLSEFVDDPDLRDELRLKIWCASIVRDSWSKGKDSADRESGDIELARAQLRDKTFFRLIDLVQLMGGDLEILLPPLEDILCAPQLAELVCDPRVLYLLRYGYETLYASPEQEHMNTAND